METCTAAHPAALVMAPLAAPAAAAAPAVRHGLRPALQDGMVLPTSVLASFPCRTALCSMMFCAAAAKKQQGDACCLGICAHTCMLVRAQDHGCQADAQHRHSCTEVADPGLLPLRCASALCSTTPKPRAMLRSKTLVRCYKRS